MLGFEGITTPFVGVSGGGKGGAEAAASSGVLAGG